LAANCAGTLTVLAMLVPVILPLDSAIAKVFYVGAVLSLALAARYFGNTAREADEKKRDGEREHDHGEIKGLRSDVGGLIVAVREQAMQIGRLTELIPQSQRSNPIFNMIEGEIAATNARVSHLIRPETGELTLTGFAPFVTTGPPQEGEQSPVPFTRDPSDHQP